MGPKFNAKTIAVLMKENENCVYIPSCKMVLWPIRSRVLFELFYKVSIKGSLFPETSVLLLWSPISL